MSAGDQSNRDQQARHKDGAFLFETRIEKLEREQDRQKKRDEERQQRDNSYKERQVELLERQTKLLRRYTALTAGLVLVGGAGLFINAWQTRQATRSADAARQGADAATSAAKTADRSLADAGESFNKTLEQMKVQARASQNGADAAIRSAKVSEVALDNAAKQFEVSMRPYVGISKVELSTELKVGEIPQAQFLLTNSGRTPAWIRQSHGTLRDGPWPPISAIAPIRLPAKWEEAEEFLEPVDIGPGQQRQITFFGVAPLAESLHAQIMKTQRTLYIQGEFKIWSPAFNAEETVEFCFNYDPLLGKRFGTCRNAGHDQK